MALIKLLYIEALHRLLAFHADELWVNLFGNVPWIQFTTGKTTLFQGPSHKPKQLHTNTIFTLKHMNIRHGLCLLITKEAWQGWNWNVQPSDTSVWLYIHTHTRFQRQMHSLSNTKPKYYELKRSIMKEVFPRITHLLGNTILLLSNRKDSPLPSLK